MHRKSLLMMVSLTGALALFLSGCGISKTTIYPGTAATPDLREGGVQILGEVEACRGAFCKKADGEGGQDWPLTLVSPPPASAYHALLRKKAAKQFQLIEEDVRLGEVTVGYYTEIDGTIVGWEAKALAGRQGGSLTKPVFIP